MYDHRKPRELHDSSPVALNSAGRVSASPHLIVSANLPAVMETSHCCDRSQPRHDMGPEAGSSSQQLRTTSGENSVYAPVSDDTKELESSFVKAATACVPQNRNGKTSVQAARGVQINDHTRADGSKQVPGDHIANWGGHGRSFPRPGTSISTILSPAPSTPNNNNKHNGSATLTGEDSAQASLRTLAHVEVSSNRESGVSSASLGKLASAREQLRLLLRGPGRRRYRSSCSLVPPSP
jgi:hypothetical protein